MMAGIWAGIPSDRVTAVLASLDTGRVQIGSGYLVTERLVLTAWHCAIDEKTGRPASKLQVVCRPGGPEADATLLAAQPDLDVAVLAVEDPPWAVPVVSEPPKFGRVDRSLSGDLHYCQAIGFPLWQVDPEDQVPQAAELHGTVQMTAEPGPGFLVMRDPLLHHVTIPWSSTAEDRAGKSPWGGLSGALVFGQGIALGVVIEHHPRQGGSAMKILPVERFAAPSPGGDPGAAPVAAALGLPPVSRLLPLADPQPPAQQAERPAQDGLLRVGELNPYLLGATPSEAGDADTYGQRDEYVPRVTDEPLTAALEDHAQVVLAGPSKAGKTRTAFEAIRQHSTWSNALLASPGPDSLEQLPSHPGFSSADPLVIWLDELDRFLPPTGELSPVLISRLLDRAGPTVLLASVGSQQRQRLHRVGELSQETRVVLDHVTWIELASTREDPGEQARAVAAYPQLGSRPDGLAEMLAGAPELLRRYLGAADDDPALHFLVRTCVDWARCGLARPMPEPDLLALARAALEESRPDLEPTDDEFGEALAQAAKPGAGGGQVALLRTVRLEDGSCGYWPFGYLMAADDGEAGDVRPVADDAWLSCLERATDEDAFTISVSAFARGNIPVAIVASHRAAEAGNASAQYNLGMLLADRLEPPELAAALTWYARAGDAGHPGAQYDLGMLLADRLEPPELDAARSWYTMAADAGHTSAQYNLAVLLANRLEPPDLAEARIWYTRAADAGHTSAQYNLGVLLADRLEPPDLAEAWIWYTGAAEAGHTSAQYNLGMLLADRVEPPDLGEARTWYTKAAEAGHPGAQYNLGVLLADRLEPPDRAEARTWYTKAAEAGHTMAQYNLGVLLATQLEPPDLDEARTWYTKAAEAGHPGAQYNLGVLLATLLDPPDLGEARTWYAKAAEAGHVSAQNNLGVLLATQLEPPDLDEARVWWTKAAEAGHVSAQNNLGVLLATLLDPPDLGEARIWLTKAAQAGLAEARDALEDLG
jgi:TPR repeat protein